MAAVTIASSGEAESLKSIPLDSKLQVNSVIIQIVSDCFQKIIATARWVWNIVVVECSYGAASFVFFRIVGFFGDTTRCEIIWLRISSIWVSFQTRWATSGLTDRLCALE